MHGIEVATVLTEAKGPTAGSPVAILWSAGQNVDQSRSNHRRTLDEPNSAFCSARSPEGPSKKPDGAAPWVNVTSTLAT